ncbi:MAG TPA: DUF4126 domain-containing protein [Chitinophagales bacterium]|nr:DUF4126 domain-containing protein [Chitinophagales bacterium]
MFSSYIIPVALGISLSACCGFRVFIPLLLASVAAKFGWLPLSAGFEWMGTYPAIIAFGVAALLEVFAYYIPVVDNFLDTLTTPSAVVAGTIVSASVFVEFDPMIRWIVAIIAGGTTAGLIQSGTGLLRLGSTKFTAGTGNHIVATIENILSFIGALFSLVIPLIMAVLFIGILGAILYYIINKQKKAAS